TGLKPIELADNAGRSSFLRRILLGSVVVLVVLLLGWMVLPHFPAKSVIRQTNVVNQAPSGTASNVNVLDGLRLLAGLGDSAAQFSLGTHYATREDLNQDYVEAARWFALAADHGHPAAQAVMSAYYEAGTGVPKDLEKAYFWAILAQAQGNETGKSRATELSIRMSPEQRRIVQQQADEWTKRHLLAGNLTSSR